MAIINDNVDNTYSQIQVAWADTTAELDAATLAKGELAINDEDGRIYYGKDDGTKGYTATFDQINNLVEELDQLRQDFEDYKVECPFDVGDIFMTTNSSDPNVTWPTTTWSKIEDRMMIGASATYPVNAMAGSTVAALVEANMPSHRHRVDSHYHTQPEHYHLASTFGMDNTGGGSGGGTRPTSGDNPPYSTQSAWGGGDNTGSSAPYTDYKGSGTSFGIMNPYYAAYIWKRLT